MSWDWLISLGIILGLIIAFWAKISKQTVPELLGSLKDSLLERGEDSVNYATEIISNE